MSELSLAAPLQTLVDEHYQLVYRYAYRLSGQAADAADLTQQTFLKAAENWSQLREQQAVRSWLCTITRNTFLQQKRKLPRMVSLPDGPVVAVAESADSESEFNPDDLQAVLLELAEEFRSPLILFYLRELSYKEISLALQIPLGTVMSRLSRGKLMLKQKLEQLRVRAQLPRPAGVGSVTASLPGKIEVKSDEKP